MVQVLKNFFTWALVLLFYGMDITSGFSQIVWKSPLDETFPVVEGRLTPMADYARFPKEMEGKVRPAVWQLSRHSAGLSIVFGTDASTVHVRYSVTGNLQMPHMPATSVSGLDLYAKNQTGEWLWVGGQFSFLDTIRYQFVIDQAIQKYTEFRLFLPLYNEIKDVKIGVEGGDLRFFPARSDNPIVVYGTSIAQGACASRPGMAWTAILQRKLDKPVVNLGFSGNGLLEKEILQHMAENKAELFVLDCLPNLGPGKGLTEVEIQKRIRDAAYYLRERQPETPILFTEHAGYSDGKVNPRRNEIYTQLNRWLEEEFEQMIGNGMPGIFLLRLEELGLDEDDFVDGTHPNDSGMMKYATAYHQKILDIKEANHGLD